MSTTITNWTPDKVLAALEARLMANAEVAGKFIEDDARTRLDAIKTPDTKRDINYRHYLSKYILTHAVEKKEKQIIIAIGMKIGNEGQRHHGFYIETGSTTAPAHPFLRPALFSNQNDIKEILGG